MNNQDNGQDDGFDTDLGFDEGNDLGTKKSNPLIKIGLIAVGLVAVLVAILTLGGGGDKTPASNVGGVSGGISTPGGGEATPQYKEAMQEYNQKQIENAKDTTNREGPKTSAIPIPIDPARRQVITKVEEDQEDPAERFRRIQEEYRKQQQTQATAQQTEQAQQNQEARNRRLRDLSQGMSSYLTQALNSRVPHGSSEITVSYQLPKDKDDTGDNTGNSSATGASRTTGANSGLIKPRVIIPATTIEYGQLMIEANTDSPGPVLALMVTGKLAGSRLLGSFQKTEEYLIITFNTLVTRDGRSMPINAIVLDPDTTLPGVITEIDHRYFRRVIVPAAANFIQGVGDALAETQQNTVSTTTSTTQNKDEPDFSDAVAEGISDSFDGISKVLEDDAGKTQPMLRVAAGTPIGILFTAEVVDPDDAAKLKDQMDERARQQQSLNPFGANPANFLPSYQPPYGQNGQPTIGTPTAVPAPAVVVNPGVTVNAPAVTGRRPAINTIQPNP